MSPFGPWKVYSRAVVGRSEKDQREGYGRLLKSLEKYGTVQEVDK